MSIDFEKIRQRCDADTRMSKTIVDDFLVYYAAAQYRIDKEFDLKWKKYKNITKDFTKQHEGFIKAQYIAYRIFQKGGLIHKILHHSAMDRFSGEEIRYLEQLANMNWQFTFSIIIDTPAEDFFLMEDILSGEVFLLYSKGTSEIMKSQQTNLWLNLLVDNGDCKVSYGPICAFRGFIEDDVFFLATELDPEIEIWQEVQENINKAPLPYVLMLSKANIPLTAHEDDLLLQHVSEYDASLFNPLKVGKEFKKEYSSGVYRFLLKEYELHPHFAQAYYDENLKIMLLTSLTARGYEALSNAMKPYSSEIDSEAALVVSLLMLNYVKALKGSEVVLNEYEKLFHVEPNEQDSKAMEVLNKAMSEIIPSINAGKKPDLKAIAKKYSLSEEELEGIVKELNLKKRRH
ncbi:hypothetical protein ACFLT1_06485 [Bacteroidota bacterium]